MYARAVIKAKIKEKRQSEGNLSVTISKKVLKPCSHTRNENGECDQVYQSCVPRKDSLPPRRLLSSQTIKDRYRNKSRQTLPAGCFLIEPLKSARKVQTANSTI